ncbi:MAG: UDP-2,4-diacetamido-2,4,6-trideoxy-beta-L-altropyranose hydrolase [Candidatus Zixiibacteriota bacterium]|nr:MAG: UDP-2,4-diacetamido-2,4,6-trideoxy-beta-L-altropyranose hydrolase [candidate division Zixibacteria bacterium]
MSMKMVIRVDSSLQIGSGHVMRCLTLADHLKETGCDISFVCRDHPGNVSALVEDKGYEVHRLPAVEDDSRKATQSGHEYKHWLGTNQATDVAQTMEVLSRFKAQVGWLIVDHYALSEEWEKVLRPHVTGIFVIDDLANRKHDCDILLDQNLNQSGSSRYENLVPPDCQVLAGPRFALLRNEFTQAAESSRERDGQIKHLLVFFGGVDSANETLKACRAILSSGCSDLAVDIVVGASNPNKNAVNEFCERHDMFEYHCQVSNIAELMSKADLCLGAGGTTTWERAYLGLPTIILPVAENQVEGTKAMAAAGAAWDLGYASKVSENEIADAISFALNDPEAVCRISRAARGLFGGDLKPGVELVVDAMKEFRHAKT